MSKCNFGFECNYMARLLEKFPPTSFEVCTGWYTNFAKIESMINFDSWDMVAAVEHLKIFILNYICICEL